MTVKKKLEALPEEDITEIMSRDSDQILCQRVVHQDNHQKILKKTFLESSEISCLPGFSKRSYQCYI
jgi:hypothetical protein